MVNAQEKFRSSPEDCLPLVHRILVALEDVPIVFRGLGAFRVTARRSNEEPSAHHGFVRGHNAVAGPSVFKGRSRGHIVLVGGTASVTSVSNGGHEIVSSGGVADATFISSGGTAIVSSGGIADATVISKARNQSRSAGPAGR
jgi:autotransporter passenger strand-loop-strand repeat protein